MIFICIECGLEMDFDEDEDAIIECWECDGDIFATGD